MSHCQTWRPGRPGMATSRTGGARIRAASSAASLGTGRTSARRPAPRASASAGSRALAPSHPGWTIPTGAGASSGALCARQAATYSSGSIAHGPLQGRRHHRSRCRHRRHSHRRHRRCSRHAHRQPRNVTVPPALAELPRLLQARPLQVGRCRRWLRPPSPSVSSRRSSHDGTSTTTTVSKSKNSCSSFMTPRCRQGLLPRRRHRRWRHLLLL